MAYVVIPAYRPDKTLISLVEQMWQSGCRIIVVDDGSGEEFQDSLRIYKDILKFTFSSLSSFVVDYLLFAGMMLIVPHTAVTILTANILARMISCFYNYSMNCRFVFGTQRELRTAMDYFALACGILVMNNVFLESFVQVIGLSVYPAKILTVENKTQI